MKSFEIDSRVENGVFRQNRQVIKSAIKHFEGQPVKLIIRKKNKQRSLNQNDFYWGVWIPIFQQLIMDEWQEFKKPNEIHEMLKQNCNYIEKVNEKTGEIIKISKSTTDLTTSEWEFEFKNKVKQLALDFFNTVLPEPNEQLTLKY